VTVCPITSNLIDTPLSRPIVEPSNMNGLRNMSGLMVDKITTVPRTKLQRRLGQLSGEDVAAMNRAVMTVLGLTRP
jgi:mRNA interferase MazF